MGFENQQNNKPKMTSEEIRDLSEEEIMSMDLGEMVVKGNEATFEKIKARQVYNEETEKQDTEELANLRESMGLEQPESESTDPKKEALDRERDLFDQSIESGDLAGAETKLMELKEQIKTSELDHKSRKLSKVAKKAGNWEIAIHMVPFASNKAGRLGRVKALPTEIQEQYADALRPYLETSESSTSENSLEAMDKTKTSYFNELIEQGLYPEAEAWVLENKDGKYTDNEDWLDHVTLPLYRNYRDNGDLKNAKRLTELLADGDAKDGRENDLSRRANKPYKEI